MYPRLVHGEGCRLVTGAVKGVTAQAYRSAYDAFTEFVWREHGVRVDGSLTYSDMDRLLSSYIDCLYGFYSGRMRHLAVRASLGVCQEVSYRYKGNLPDSARRLQAWARLHPPRSSYPLPRAWVDLIGFTLAARGHALEGIAVLLAWEGYLRVSELLSLRREHVMLPENTVGLGMGRHCGLHLLDTKRGPNQFVRVRDVAIVRYLRWLHQRTTPGALLFAGVTGQQLNRLLVEACAVLGFPPHFTMHSCRHGHASDDFVHNVDPEITRRNGRWGHLFSMTPYLQGVAVLSYGLVVPSDLLPFLAISAELRRYLLSFGALQ
jgi:integrase